MQPSKCLLFIFLFIDGYPGKIIRFKDCGSSTAFLTGIDVDPCDNPDNCSLKRGTKPTITIKFKPKSQINKVKAVVHGIIDGIPMPFPLPNPDGCRDSGLECPLIVESDNSYNQSLEIKSIYPSISTIFADFIFDEGACRPHGFTPALTCDGCQELHRWKLDALKSICEKCCSIPASQEEKKYNRAQLVMCRCKFGMFPHITDFINSKDFKVWSGLEHVHKPGASPKLNFLNDDGQVEQSVNIEGWNIDSLKEFLKLKLEF